MAKRDDKAEGEPTKRKPGRPRGHAKTGGRKPKVSYATRGEVAGHLLPKWAALAEDILDGKPLQVSGPTGKPQRRIATMDEKISVLRMVGGKVMADLQSSTLKAEVEVHKERAEPRELARAVLGIFNSAKLAEEAEHPIAEPSFEDPRPAPAQLLLGRDAYIETNSASDQPSTTAAALNGGGSGVSGSGPSSLSNGSTNTSPPTTSQGDVSADEGTTSRLAAVPSSSSDKLEHGDIIRIESNGSHLWWDANRRKYHCFDNNNVSHGMRADRAVALAHAAGLPVGDNSDWQEHPFKFVTAQAIGDEPRRDNRGHLPRAELKIVRQRPR